MSNMTLAFLLVFEMIWPFLVRYPRLRSVPTASSSTCPLTEWRPSESTETTRPNPASTWRSTAPSGTATWPSPAPPLTPRWSASSGTRPTPLWAPFWWNLFHSFVSRLQLHFHVKTTGRTDNDDAASPNNKAISFHSTNVLKVHHRGSPLVTVCECVVYVCFGVCVCVCV